MKLKLCLVAMIGLACLNPAARAQSTDPANPNPAPAPAESVQADATPAAAPAVEAATAADAPATAAAEPAPAAPAAEPAPATPVAEPAPATPAPAPAVETAPAASAPAPDTTGLIPLIVMDDVPLTDAIKNLARQAELNYMLDPLIGFGQPAADGRPVPQPTVSIRWENVTAQQALTALLGNYNLQITEDPKSKIARITTKDPAAPDPLVTRIIQLKYANPSNVLASVQSTLTDKRSKVVADIRTSQLVVLATEKEMVAVDDLVTRLDTQTRQVLIEARLIEMSVNPKTKKGVDWSDTLANQHVAFGNNLKANVPSESMNNTLATSLPKLLFDTAKGFNPATAFLDADGVEVVLSFLNNNAEAKVLSAPRAVTLDNETAHISVTRANPIFKNTAGTQGSPGGSEVTYTNLGVILTVTPRISANNYVNLQVIPEVSRVFDTARKIVSGTVNEADIYDVRRIETRVMIPSGNTLVLGGLVRDDVREASVKVPILGDIPILGYAFRSDSKSREKANLLIFITPTIIQESDFQPTKSDFLKTPVPTSDSLEDDWGPWDTGKKKDWSKRPPAEKAAEFSSVQ
jgi:type II secretory pathway component GspD/PulD (secretin)